MLRTESQVALQDLLEALRAAADMYADNAEVLAEGELAELCRALALRRGQQAQAVADELRRRGDLPGEPDADRETLQRLGHRLRTLVAGNERAVVVQDRLDAEAELAELAAQAAGLVTEPATQALLADIRRDSEQSRAALSRFAAS